MYPLKVILIGEDKECLPIVRRELLNQSVEIDVEYPDIASAIENLNLRYDENRLFVCHIDGTDHGDCLKQLSGAFAGRPIVVLLEGEASSSSVVHAMRDGAAQVVMLPLDAADFRQAIDSVAVQFGHLGSKSKVIAISSAHGGVGVTTLAVNLAYESAQTYKLDTIVAELSFNFGMLSSFLNVEPRFTTLELLGNGHELDIYSLQKALVPFSDRLSILAGPSHAMKSVNVEKSMISRLIHSLRQLADIVILDVPSTLDEVQMTALDAADQVVLVADQTIPSLQMTAESLRLGIRTHAPVVLVNRFDPKLPGLDASRIKDALAIDELRTIALDHDALTATVNSGQPLRLVFPKSKALVDIDALAEELLGAHGAVPPVAKTDGFISHFVHALGIR